MKGDVKGIKEVMSKGSDTTGMQTFDDSLFKLYDEGKITQDQAIVNADSANDMRLRMNLAVVDEGNGNGKEAEPDQPAAYDEDNPLAGMKLLDDDEEV